MLPFSNNKRVQNITQYIFIVIYLWTLFLAMRLYKSMNLWIINRSLYSQFQYSEFPIQNPIFHTRNLLIPIWHLNILLNFPPVTRKRLYLLCCFSVKIAQPFTYIPILFGFDFVSWRAWVNKIASYFICK